MSHTHEFLVGDEEGLGQGDVGDVAKDNAVYNNEPSEQLDIIQFGIISKGNTEVFAALTHRLGPDSFRPSTPIVKVGSDILSATLRVNPSASESSNVDVRLACMKHDDRWSQELGVYHADGMTTDFDSFGGSFVGTPNFQLEVVNPVSPSIIYDVNKAVTRNNTLRKPFASDSPEDHDFGRVGMGMTFRLLGGAPIGVLNRAIIEYNSFPSDGNVWVEIWSTTPTTIGVPWINVFPKDLLATSDVHTVLPAVEPGFGPNSRAFTFSGSDVYDFDDGLNTYMIFVRSDTTDAGNPRIFFATGRGQEFLDSEVSVGRGHGLGAPMYNHDQDYSDIYLTDDGVDTLNSNHVGSPVTFLNLPNWTAGVDFDFTSLETMIQSAIDDAQFVSGAKICTVIDPVQTDEGDTVTRAFTSINGDDVGAKLILTWNDPDETPPIVSVDFPAEGACLKGTLQIDATATDPQGADEVAAAGVDEVRALLVGASPELIGTDGTGDASDQYNISFDTTLYPDGVYTLRVEAEDLATPTTNTGNAEITITIDNTAPTGSVTDPSDGATVVGTVGVVVSASDPTSGVASVELLVDGATTGIIDTTSPFLLGWDSTSVLDGSHTLAARMVDNCGNSADTAAITVIVANAGGALVESQQVVVGLSTVKDATQAATLRVEGISSVETRGGSQLVVKEDE